MPIEWKGRTVLVVGGTGSLGQHLVTRLLVEPLASIRVYSRDEFKQVQMRRSLVDDRLSFMLGDIRDRARLRQAVRGVDLVINAAALKHVPICEAMPTEAIQTNVQGARFLVEEAITAGAKVIIGISTDKAVEPINVLGLTKALQEKILLASSHSSHTRVMVVRYGNVLASRGSVAPLLVKCVRNGEMLPLTDKAMTRFLLTLTEAVETVYSAINDGASGEIWIRRSGTVNILDFARTLARALGKGEDYPYREIGVRPGEKLHELLVHKGEVARATMRGDYITIGLTESPDNSRPEFQEYSSSSVKNISQEKLLAMIRDSGVLGQVSTSIHG